MSKRPEFPTPWRVVPDAYGHGWCAYDAAGTLILLGASADSWAQERRVLRRIVAAVNAAEAGDDD